MNKGLKDVLLHGSDVLSGPAIPLALGLYVIASQGGSSINNCPGMYVLFAGGRNNTF